ncbi:MAG: hypothetical protein TEF_10235 [Rhizobiales bacterium NRL2]|jgi:hypothetical protein|nr:MAG: hypothetical protein TEF_10235 [Rhizobiales bacterium NRL2]
MSTLARLLRDRGGASTVEFALIAGVALSLMTTVFEISMIGFARQAMDTAAHRAVRLGMTGRAPDDGAWIAAAVERATAGIVPADEIRVTAAAHAGFGEAGPAEPFTDSDGDGVHDPSEPFTDNNGNGIRDDGAGVPGAGGASDVVVYRLEHVWRAITPGIGRLFEGRVLTTTLTVQNEPF